MYSLGLDFGSTAVRALIIDLDRGIQTAAAGTDYPCGTRGVCLREEDPCLARQEPDAYIAAMTESILAAEALARAADPGFSPELVAGIGADATATTLIPVSRDMTPLSRKKEFAGDLDAASWMWKDHTSFAESREITELARQLHPEYLARCGGTYSSEWFWSKVLHALRAAPRVFEAAYAWIELCDFIPAVLAGIGDYDLVRCSSGAAGHKAMYSPDWGGLPDEDFLRRLDPKLAALRRRLYQKTFASDAIAGRLSPAWAEKFGMKPGTPVAAGLIDAHSGAAGSGAGPGKLVCIIGTSACDITAAKFNGPPPEIKGISGIAADSVLPGYYGIEGGHAAVGDSFFWQATTICGIDVRDYGKLEAEAAKIVPSPHSVIALDWLNGNRNPYADESLRGVMVGMTLRTTPAELYRAWLEATAFGIRQVTDILRDAGFGVDEIICCGGIPEKSPLLMQICADVLGKKLLLPAGHEICALGAALAGAVVGGAFPSVEEAQKNFCRYREQTYTPSPARREIYDLLYEKYVSLGQAFAAGPLAGIMH